MVFIISYLPTVKSILNVVSAFQEVSIVRFHVHHCNNTSSHFVAQDGRTALMRASDKSHVDVVQPLLSVGAQVDQQDKVRHSISS